MVGFCSVFVIYAVVVFIGFVCNACYFNRAAAFGINVLIFSDADLRNKRLKPTPLCNQGKAFVHIGVYNFLAVIVPGYACNVLSFIVVAFLLAESNVAAVNLEILRRNFNRSFVDGIIAGYSMLRIKKHTSELIRVNGIDRSALRNVNGITG